MNGWKELAKTLSGVARKSTAVRLRSTVEVTPTGMKVFASGDPINRGRLWNVRYVPPGHVPHGLLTGLIIGNPRAGFHSPDSETVGSGPPSINKDSRPLRTGQRPVLSQYILSQCSGVMRSSGLGITPPALERGWNM